MVVINFEFDSPYGKFADAIVLPDDNTYTEAEIEAMKQQRYNNWLAVVSAVPDETPQE